MFPVSQVMHFNDLHLHEACLLLQNVWPGQRGAIQVGDLHADIDDSSLLGT